MRWLLWPTLFGVLFGGAVFYSTPSHADPITPSVAVYAAQNAPAVCSTLADFPSIPGLEGVMDAIVTDGFTGYQAGQIVALAVQARCPRFEPLLEEFVREVQHQQGVTA